MMFAAVAGHGFGRATPSLRNAPPRQLMEIVRGETVYRNRNAVQTNPATSPPQRVWNNSKIVGLLFFDPSGTERRRRSVPTLPFVECNESAVSHSGCAEP